MTSSHPLPAPCQWFSRLAAALDRRSAPRLALLLLGAVLARGRRTVTTWIRAAKLSDPFRPCYTAVAAAGKRADRIARRLLTEVVRPLLKGATRLTLALDDTPTKRYGPHVQGAGVHHNPTPGPAGSPGGRGPSALDFLLNFTEGRPPPALVGAARLGCWTYLAGDNRLAPYGLAAFGQPFARDRVISAALVASRSDGRQLVLHAGRLKSRSTYAATCGESLAQTTGWVARVCREPRLSEPIPG